MTVTLYPYLPGLDCAPIFKVELLQGSLLAGNPIRVRFTFRVTRRVRVRFRVRVRARVRVSSQVVIFTCVKPLP